MTDYDDIKKDTTTRMEKTLETLRGDFGGLRAGRAHASLLDNIMVEAYGNLSPISQVGTISVPDARTLSISVWDKDLAKSVEKALRESDLGLNPVSDGQLIRIPIPPLGWAISIQLSPRYIPSLTFTVRRCIELSSESNQPTFCPLIQYCQPVAVYKPKVCAGSRRG